MKKKYILNLILINIFILGVVGIQACCNDYKVSCDKNSDCYEHGVCIDGVCQNDECEEHFCGVGGTCVQDYIEVHCQCDENSLPYEKVYSHSLICTPKCKIHDDCNEAYVNLGHQIAGYCIKGQCQERNYCEQNSDCPDGEICETKHCRTAPIDGK